MKCLLFLPFRKQRGYWKVSSSSFLNKQTNVVHFQPENNILSHFFFCSDDNTCIAFKGGHMLLAGTNVLVVEDDADLREIISKFLIKRGCKVLQAENGEVAFGIFKDQPVDLIISDIRMPVCDGINLTKRIREINPKVPPIILVTGYSEVELSEALAVGALKVFNKPYKFTELESFIHTIEL